METNVRSRTRYPCSFFFTVLFACMASASLATEAPALLGASDGLVDPFPHAAPEPPKPGVLRVLVFSAESGEPLPNVRVRVGTAEDKTNAYGAAYLVVIAGLHTLELSLPGAVHPASPARLVEVPVGPGESTQVIAEVNDHGELVSVEVESPPGASSPRQTVGTAAVDEDVLGQLQGTVKALEGSAPVRGARVFVRGASAEAESDEQGRFALVLPSGDYTISVIHPSYSTQSMSGVLVARAQVTTILVELSPASVELDEYFVLAPRIEGSVASLLEARRQSGVASDAIGAEEIAGTPAGDAASAAQRIVGVTLVGGRFVYVRGLGERYTNALLNNLPLPSPEPDRATVPLDLFPTALISSIDVVKTFSPDMPGDFAGGSIRIESIGVPDGLKISGSMSTEANSQTTFRPRPAAQRGRFDRLGFDDGSRALPMDLPEYQLSLNNSRGPGLGRVNADELRALAPRFNSSKAVHRELAMPNLGASLSVGNGWKIWGGQKIGAWGAFTYSHKTTYRKEVQRVYQPGDEEELFVWQEADVESARDSVRWGAFTTMVYEPTARHRVRFLGFRSQLADDSAQLYEGFSANSFQRFYTSHIEYVSRALTVGQLRGEHEIALLGGAQLDWRLSLSGAERQQPDTRDVVYNYSESLGQWTYFNNSDSGRHFFADQNEAVRSAAMDWTQPFSVFGMAQKVKLGALVQQKERAFTARRFAFMKRGQVTNEATNCKAPFDPAACPNKLFTEENVTGDLLQFQELTRGSDSYVADLNVSAAYLMLDSFVTDWLRLVGGARLEHTHQRIAEVELFTREPREERNIELNALDLLPAASLIFLLHEQVQLRAAVSQTLARPQLRELASFAFADYFGGSLVSGNPNLKLTRIQNADLRVEFFSGPRDVLSVSGFAKRFEDPIEAVVTPSGSSNTVTFQNADGGMLVGLELEARQGLGVLSDMLRDLSVNVNVTVAHSEVAIEQSNTDQSGEVGFLTSTRRPMVNQAPYVVNAMLDYEGAASGTQLRLLYNVAGPRLVEVGTQGLPDAYLHPRHQLDFAASQRIWSGLQLKLRLQNLLDAEHRVTQGADGDSSPVVASFREGISVSLGVGGSF
jgi:outer membrane receptor protein involved in Fe transport